MVQLEKGVVVKDVLARQLKEGYVLGMGQSSNDAATKDVPTKPSRKECVSGMVRRYQSVVMMDATTML